MAYFCSFCILCALLSFAKSQAPGYAPPPVVAPPVVIKPVETEKLILQPTYVPQQQYPYYGSSYYPSYLSYPAAQGRPEFFAYPSASYPGALYPSSALTYPYSKLCAQYYGGAGYYNNYPYNQKGKEAVSK